MRPGGRTTPSGRSATKGASGSLKWWASWPIADSAPAVVATSPLVRCRQTAEIIARQIAGKPRLVPRDELSPGSDLDKLLDWTASFAANEEQIAWVGHAPDVGELAAALIGDGSSNLVFAKGAIAAIEFDGPPARQKGELRWLVTAKILGCCGAPCFVDKRV